MAPCTLLLAALLLPTTLAGFHYCHRPNLDCTGFDIRSMLLDTFCQCQEACTGEPGCKSIQYYHGRCWLKHKACQNNELTILQDAHDYVKLDASQQCTDYQSPTTKYCKRQGMDCAGHDIVSMDWVSTAEECLGFCDWYDNCKSIQFQAKCWLKNYACENGQLADLADGVDYLKIPIDDNCDDYRVQFGFQYCERPNLDCTGHDIYYEGTESLDKCHKMCSLRSECSSVQYFKNICYLKNYVCKNPELTAGDGFRDFVKVNTAADCTAEIVKLD